MRTKSRAMEFDANGTIVTVLDDHNGSPAIAVGCGQSSLVLRDEVEAQAFIEDMLSQCHAVWMAGKAAEFTLCYPHSQGEK